MSLTTRERFVRTLLGQEVDRVPFMKIFGGDAAVNNIWLKDYPNLPGYIDELLQFEGGYRGWRIVPVNYWLCGEITSKVVAETDETVTVRYSTGEVVLAHKHGDFHRHTLEYPVKTPEDWDRIKSTLLDPLHPARLPKDYAQYVELYRNREFPLQLTCGGVYGFARTMMGDEALCYAIYDEPEMVADIINTYIDMCLKLWEVLCRDIDFDLIECWEDMASKTGAIISPASFNQFLAPNYRKIRAFADAHRIPLVLVDCDGNVNELAKDMVANGVNAMYPFEVGAGCDVLKVLDANPRLGALGCLEKNACALGKDAIDEQMEIAKTLIKHGRIIPGPDHFVLENVPFENYKYFMNRLREVIFTTTPGQN